MPDHKDLTNILEDTPERMQNALAIVVGSILLATRHDRMADLAIACREFSTSIREELLDDRQQQ